jgi:hypothetical protein
MKIKEKIENLKDLRRNFWVTSAAIIGSLSMLLLTTTKFILGWLFIVKTIIVILGSLLTSFFISEIVCCNKEINKLLNKLKEE